MRYRFAELVDIDRFRQMMHSFFEATGLSVALVDPDNNILCGEGWQEICTEFHRRNTESVLRCFQSDHFIAEHLHDGPFTGYRCLNGLMDYASPVVIDGEHVATMFTGQFFHEAPDVEFFRHQARTFDFDEAKYLAALQKVPILPEEKARAVMRFYAELAGMLARSGLDRLLQKETENRVTETNRGLEQRTRELEAVNAEMEEFSYSISHDLRAPLRAIDGFAHLLNDTYAGSLDAEGRRLLNVIRDNAFRMNELIDGIARFLSVGRRPIVPETVDMAALAAEVWAGLVASLPERHIRIRIADLPAATGDREFVRQILSHLLANAIKFTAPRAEAVIELDFIAGDQENTYTIRDNGVGFDMQYEAKLFRVFERLHSPGEFPGAGIGLATVRRIVLRLGGQIRGEGRPGEGATIYFSLPAKQT